MAIKQGIPSFTPEYETTTDIGFSEKDLGIMIALAGLLNVLKQMGMVSGAIEKQTGTLILKGNYVAWGINVCTRGGITRRLVKPGVKLRKGNPDIRHLRPVRNGDRKGEDASRRLCLGMERRGATLVELERGLWRSDSLHLPRRKIGG